MSTHWTAHDIPSQRGRTAIVTGANSGLGRIVARELARGGAEVIIATRDTGRGNAAAAAIKTGTPSATLEVSQLDLASLKSVRAFAERFLQGHAGLDLLVNNAGVMAAPRQLTEDGFELQLATNHLGHFALTGLLLPALRNRPAARVVTVSSNYHKNARIRFDDLQGERHYSRWAAYGQSKLANLLFAFELDRRLAAAGLPLISVAGHPGYSATNLQLGAQPLYERMAMWVSNRLIAQSAEMGALPILYAATVADVQRGAYVGPDGRGERRGYPTLVSPSARALDTAVAQQLWTVSEQLAGVRYEIGMY